VNPFRGARVGALGQNAFGESAGGINVDRIIQQRERLQRRVERSAGPCTARAVASKFTKLG
jgi:hypothetical protein